jgi:hypothetical protein
MAGPNNLVRLGSLSRLIGSLTFGNLPQLNVTAPFLGREGIRHNLNGDITQFLPQMVSQVQSQEVYIPITLTVPIVKTTAVANLFKRQWESDSNLGDCTFRSDSSSLDVFDFYDCGIAHYDGTDTSGTNAVIIVTIGGTYYVNSDLFNG